MGEFPAFVATMKFQTFNDKRKIIFSNYQIFPHEPETLNPIFPISLLGTAQPLFERQAGRWRRLGSHNLLDKEYPICRPSPSLRASDRFPLPSATG